MFGARSPNAKKMKNKNTRCTSYGNFGFLAPLNWTCQVSFGSIAISFCDETPKVQRNEIDGFGLFFSFYSQSMLARIYVDLCRSSFVCARVSCMLYASSVSVCACTSLYGLFRWSSVCFFLLFCFFAVCLNRRVLRLGVSVCVCMQAVCTLKATLDPKPEPNQPSRS